MAITHALTRARSTRRIATALLGVGMLGGTALAVAPQASAASYGCVSIIDAPTYNGLQTVKWQSHAGWCAGANANWVRVKSILQKEKVRWGPVPNGWDNKEDTGWSGRVPYVQLATAKGTVGCSGLKGELRTKSMVEVSGTTGLQKFTKYSAVKKPC